MAEEPTAPAARRARTAPRPPGSEPRRQDKDLPAYCRASAACASHSLARWIVELVLLVALLLCQSPSRGRFANELCLLVLELN